MTTLLVIDDEPTIGLLIRRLGEACGYRVTDVSDPDDFKHAFFADPPAVIGIDLSMPRIDGVQLLHFLADQQCAAKLLIISGSEGGAVRAAARLGTSLGLDVAAVLHKPFRIAQLRTVLAEIKQGERSAAA